MNLTDVERLGNQIVMAALTISFVLTGLSITISIGPHRIARAIEKRNQ